MSKAGFLTAVQGRWERRFDETGIPVKASSPVNWDSGGSGDAGSDGSVPVASRSVSEQNAPLIHSVEFCVIMVDGFQESLSSVLALEQV